MTDEASASRVGAQPPRSTGQAIELFPSIWMEEKSETDWSLGE